MKKIEAIIRHFKLEALVKATEELGIGAMTVTEVEGRGKIRPYTTSHDRGSWNEDDLFPKHRIEMFVDDGAVYGVTLAICKSCQTGRAGDGCIWISNVESAIRIRTGENGPEALA